MNLKTIAIGIVALAIAAPAYALEQQTATAVAAEALADVDPSLFDVQAIIRETEEGCDCDEGGWWWGSSCDLTEKCPSGTAAYCGVEEGSCVCYCRDTDAIIAAIDISGGGAIDAKDG